MQLSQLFPNEYRAFCCGPLSLCVERFGGVNSISLLDVREFCGKLYPDRFPVPWLRRRGGATMGRPLYSPAIQFFHGFRNYVPVNAEIYPFGFTSAEYSLALTEKSAAFRFSGFPGEKLVMTLSKFHMFEGECPALKNQLAVIASNIQWLPEELRGEGFDSAKPFPEKEMILSRRPPVVEHDQIVFEAECRYPDHVKKQFWVIRSDSGLDHFSEIPNGWEASYDSVGREISLTFGFGASLAEAQQNADRSFRQNFEEREKNCNSALRVEIENLDSASDFFRQFPGFQRHLLLAETDREVCIRAAADKFGFFALWDHVYPARDFLLTGEPERTRKALRYMLNYPWVETCSWITMQLILLADEYLAYSDDSDFLKECMPHFERYFEFSCRFSNPETGLLATSQNVGVDCSAEVKLFGLFYASCLNGWWYDSLRVLENFARESGRMELAEKALNLSCKVEAHYEKAFFDEAEGYLRAARQQDGSLPLLQVYQNTHTLGMEYIHGAWLFRRIVRRLAAYQAERLYHPTGHTAVSRDSAVPCEMWKSVHMNQHLGHECKTARFGGRSDEAERVMRGWLEYFQRFQCAVETFNLAGCDGDAGQLANWQAFSATAAAQGLIAGVAGWFRHRGGWNWVPGSGSGSKIHDLNGSNFSVSGTGAYADGIHVDGVLMKGTLQASGGRKKYEIFRSETTPEHPVLLLAADAAVGHLTCERNVLEFQMENSVHAPVQIYAPRRPEVLLNGKRIEFDWFEESKTLWFDAHFRIGDRITVRIT